MGTPKLKKEAFETKNKQVSDAPPKNITTEKEKKDIEILKHKITEFLKDEKNAKKAALALENMLNNSKNKK